MPGASARSATTSATRFSPRRSCASLLATDVLSEGQNLQDGAIVVNFDLPWAIIRLDPARRPRRPHRTEVGEDPLLLVPARRRRRAHHPPARARAPAAARERRGRRHRRGLLRGRDRSDQTLLDLYHEKAGILDGDADTEVDLASYAYQIWKNAIDRDPDLQKIDPGAAAGRLLDAPTSSAPTRKPHGALVYLRTARATTRSPGWTRMARASPSRSSTILKAAECAPDTPALPRRTITTSSCARRVELIVAEEKSVGGQLGRPPARASAPTSG